MKAQILWLYPINLMNTFMPYTRKTLLLLLFLCSSCVLFASTNGSLSAQDQSGSTLNVIDSLKKQLSIVEDDSLKASLYSKIAAQYLKYDSTASKREHHTYQNEAISNTLSAIHHYSKYDDSVGLRNSFDVLAKVYHAQHKYIQAKWFSIQSNSISRAINDYPNIIASLLELASVKADIKDYKLAVRDLNEALAISSKNHLPKQEADVQLRYAMFYNVIKNPQKAEKSMKRYAAINDSIKRDNEARTLAKLKTTDSLQQVKKKVYMNGSNGKVFSTATVLSSSL
jgi:tetratricopeptide (TPR) repeat protein